MITYPAKVQDGVLHVKHRKDFDREVSALSDGDYVLTLEDRKEARSSRSNRYYWAAVVGSLCQHIEGYSKEEIHEILRYKFCRRPIADPETGEMVEVSMPTHSMTRDDFAAYVDSCIRWAAELGCVVPDPPEG